RDLRPRDLHPHRLPACREPERDLLYRACPQDRTMSDLPLSLLNDFQRGFPLVARPFDVISARLGLDLETLLDTLRRLTREGVISRVGAVFRPNRVGASTLAAVAVPEDRLAEVARLVSARPEVNHNYE